MKTILLPDGVADSWFFITAGGEVYESRVCRGADLMLVLAELCFGSKDEEHEALDEYARDLADGDFWHVNNGRCVGCSLACGEDPDIEIRLIQDPRAVALLEGNAAALAP